MRSMIKPGWLIIALLTAGLLGCKSAPTPKNDAPEPPREASTLPATPWDGVAPPQPPPGAAEAAEAIEETLVGGVPVSEFFISSAVGSAITPAPLLVHPFPNGIISSTWGDPRDHGRRVHRAVDIQGLGQNLGLGEPIRSLTRARVIRIGKPASDSRRYGRQDRRKGHVRRHGRRLPRSMEIEGYGKVYFFTRTLGSSRMGAAVVTEGIGGDLDRHRIRYIHLGAPHPDLKIGDIIEAGQEIGVMGGTAVQSSWPHLHFDIADPKGKRVDPRPFLDLVDPKGRRDEIYCDADAGPDDPCATAAAAPAPQSPQ